MPDSTKKLLSAIAGFIIALNTLLLSQGVNIIDNETLNLIISLVLDVFCICWIAWHNWNATDEAKTLQGLLYALKEAGFSLEVLKEFYERATEIVHELKARETLNVEPVSVETKE